MRMPSSTIMVVVVVVAAIILVGMVDRGAATHVAFANNGVMDDVMVTLSIGTPSYAYTLRVIFASSVYTTNGTHIGLFNNRHHIKSSSYETLIRGHLGVDTAEFSANRWRAKIVYLERTVADMDVDGIWLISPHTPVIAYDAWRHFLVTRHGFHAGDDAKQALQLRSCAEALCAVDSFESTALGALDNVTLRIGNDPAETHTYRIVVAPEQITTYLPMALFQRYFEGRNMHADRPTDWPQIELTTAGGCVFIWHGESFLPRSEMMPGGTSTYSEPLLQKIFHENVQTGSAGEIHEGPTRRGYNYLKIHSHLNDTHTIILGGNVLWASSSLYIDEQSGRALLVSDVPGRYITLMDAIWLITLCVTYIRWKFSGSWLDTCDRGDHTMVIITRVSLITSLSLYTSKLMVYLFYVPWLVPLVHPADAIVVYGGALVDVILVFILFLSMRTEIVGAVADTLATVVGLWKYVIGHARDLPSSMPVVNERLSCTKQWSPRSAYARKRANRDFVWLDTDFYVLYVILIDIVFASTTWLTVAPFEDRLFADIITFLAFSVVSYEVMYFFLLLTSAFFVNTKRVALSRRHLGLVLPGLLAMGVALYTSVYVVHRIVDDYSTTYEGRILVFIAAFYMLILLFLASLVARGNLVSNLVPLTVGNENHAD